MEKEITKDNYKGYIALYKSMNTMTQLEYSNFIQTMGKCFGIGLFFIILSGVIPLSIFLILGIISEIGILTEFLYKNSKIKRDKFNLLKKEYNYLDPNIKKEELEESLKEAKILTYEDYGNCVDAKLNVNAFEKYLEAEKIKEEYLEETKYSGYAINPNITHEELDRPKVKKLVR